MTTIVFEAERTGYTINQALYDCPMTVGDLKELLNNYDEDDIIIISHDHGYTYGSLHFVYDLEE